MNPIVLRKGVCDPHIHIFEGRAYLYATHDAPGYEDDFHMDDWQIWSSENLIDWQLESTVHPEDFYCGALNQCWALDAAYKNGKYYLYFSTGDWGVGAAVSDDPRGPFVDARGEALVDYREHPAGIPKWDPCVFQDDDKSAYLIVGTCRQNAPWDCYLIARLKEDMIHLAEPLRRLEYTGNPWPEDKASIHKYNGKYYLTHSSYYAVSDEVYGPYQYMGNTGCNIDHGSYFTYQNQTYFASGGMDNPNRYLRASFLAPCHYRKDGRIAVDQKMMEYGCGQYDSIWKKIEAAWYFGASRECKKEGKDGKFLTELYEGEHLCFPDIANIETDAVIQFMASARNGGRIIIHETAPDGPVLGVCRIGKTKELYQGKLKCGAGKKSLCFVAQGDVDIWWFSFPVKKKKHVLEPVFSVLGRGASLAFDPDGTNHQVLQNMELKGAAMEAWADGGNGGDGMLSIPYYCSGADTELKVFVNGDFQGNMEFPVTASPCLGKEPCISRKGITLAPGLNRIRICSQEYQMGRLAVDHIVVESKSTECGVYAAANGYLEPRGNGCWDGFPQRETDPGAYSGRIVKYLGNPGDEIMIEEVEGGNQGEYTLAIHYCRGEEGRSAYLLLVNGKESGTLLFESTGKFSAKCMETYSVDIRLARGRNTLQLRKTGLPDQGIYVDAFSVIRRKG